MREIKFRFWNKENKRMFYADKHGLMSGNLEQILFANTEAEMNKLTHNLIIMQFTGLLDKNSVEIYEGDIVMISLPGFGLEKKITVEWNGNGYGSMCEDYHREVIGNIYENKELLDE